MVLWGDPEFTISELHDGTITCFDHRLVCLVLRNWSLLFVRILVRMFVLRVVRREG